MLKDVKKSELNNELNEGLKLLVFHATWCGPCRMYKNSLEEAVEKDGIDIYRINIDEDKEFAAEMNVQSIPATFVLKDGKVVKNFLGYRPYKQLSKELEELK